LEVSPYLCIKGDDDDDDDNDDDDDGDNDDDNDDDGDDDNDDDDDDNDDYDDDDNDDHDNDDVQHHAYYDLGFPLLGGGVALNKHERKNKQGKCNIFTPKYQRIPRCNLPDRFTGSKISITLSRGYIFPELLCPCFYF